MTGTERKRAWRQKQASLSVAGKPALEALAPPRRDLVQDLSDRLKSIRAVVRLKHSKAADREIKGLIDLDTKSYWKAIQQGRVPAPLDLQTLADGAL